MCSRLSSGFKSLFNKLFGKTINCQKIHLDTYDSNVKRVGEFNNLAPNCACESFRMSEYSPAPIDNSESLARFVFTPLHLTKKGGIKPNLFSHVFNKGCSIQRDAIASNNELGSFIVNFLALDSKFKWEGVVIGKSEELRKLLIDSSKNRALCLYDTAEKENPAHGEVHITSEMDEADEMELRHDLFKAFNSSSIVLPSNYRDGGIHSCVPQEMHSRII